MHRKQCQTNVNMAEKENKFNNQEKKVSRFLTTSKYYFEFIMYNVELMF
jgi:hypothetical protein